LVLEISGLLRRDLKPLRFQRLAAPAPLRDHVDVVGDGCSLKDRDLFVPFCRFASAPHSNALY
jgi:hypothetical protein